MAEININAGWYNKEEEGGASGTSYANLFKNSGEYTYSEGNGNGESGSICGPVKTSECNEEEYWFEVPLINWDTDEVEVTKGAKKYSSCNNEMLVTWFNNGSNTSYDNVIDNVDIFEIKNIDECDHVLSTKDTTMYPFITGQTTQVFEENFYVDKGFPSIITNPYVKKKCDVDNPKKYAGRTNGHKIAYLPFNDTIPSNCITGNSDLVEIYFPHIYNKYEDERFNNVRKTRVISDGAFSGNSRLSAVTFSETVKIGEKAFYNCNNLTNIDWGHICVSGSNCEASSVTKSIGVEAFRYCNGLPLLDLPSLNMLGEYAFADCNGISAATFSYGPNEIEEGCFSNCTNLETVKLSSGVYTIEDKVFSGCNSLSSITVTDYLHEIGDDIFDGCNFTADSNGVIYAGEYEKNGVTYNAFLVGVTSDFNATTYAIKNGTKFICSGAFSGQTGLTRITTNGTIEVICSHAFEDCTSLTAITNLTAVTRIGKDAFTNCGINYVSSGINYADSNHKYLIGPVDNTQSTYIIHSNTNLISDGAFEGNGNLTNISMPSVLMTIGRDAFKGCTGLTSVGLSTNTGLHIEEGAFENCTSLASITRPIPSTTTIEDNAFKNCIGVTSVTLGNITIPSDANPFNGCTGIESISLASEKIDDWFKGITSLESVQIDGSSYEILDEAFKGCSSLSSITISTSVGEIGDMVFDGCSSLPVSGGVMYADCCAVSANNVASITIENGTRFICDKAFIRKTNMTGITIPDSVIDIGKYAFSGCTKLKSVSSSCYTIDDDAFAGCTALTGCNLNNIQVIGKETFMGCSSLSSITLPDTIKDIHEYAFKKCTKLKTITVEAYKDESHTPPLSEIPILRYSALLDCPSDMNIYVPSGETINYKELYSWDEYGEKIKPIE